MNYIVSEVNRYAELDKNGTDIYYMKLLELEENVNETNKAVRIELMTTTYETIQLEPKLFMCKSPDVKDCQPTKE